MNQVDNNADKPNRKNPEEIAKRTAKDSVFTDLFQDPKYLIQLYQALHPEDQSVTEASITNVTIKNILLDQCYNDLVFCIGDKLVILVEAQSTWTVNIVVRGLMYLAQTYQEHIEKTGQNIYGSKRVNLPKPELYVIFTGERKSKPEYLYLSKEFFGGEESAIEVKVKMIYDGKEGDIINQYVTFTKIYNEQVKQHGRTREAVLETIRICKDKNVLKEYLENRELEVVNIMMTLFNDEYILKTYVTSKEKEAAEAGANRKSKSLAEKMYKRGDSIKDIADFLDASVEEVENWLGLVTI